MACRAIEIKRKFAMDKKIGEAPAKGFFRALAYKVRRMYWTNRIGRMNEGQVMDLYYELTR